MRKKAAQPKNVQTLLSPCDDRVIIKLVAVESKTAGGLYIPDQAKDKSSKGEILAVGPGKVSEFTNNRIPLGFSPGNIVLFGRFAGTEIVVDNQTLLIVKASDILSIVEEG